MKALIVGYGSIAQRHVRLLKDLRIEVGVVSSQSIQCKIQKFDSIELALHKFNPEYIIIANSTDKHYYSLNTLIQNNFLGKVLVEKPLFDRILEFNNHCFTDLRVAYNLRRHPLLIKLKSLLSHRKIFSANIYVGAYLPDWRPNTDYTKGYSASKEKGGGVLRDLSHELDYANWLLGKWKRLTALGGQFSSLDISSDDVYSILLDTEFCPAVSIHLNYLDRKPFREMIINTEKETIRVSLSENSLAVNGDKEEIIIDRDFTYIEEHKSMIHGNSEDLCSLIEGKIVMEMIDACEESVKSKTWVYR